MGWKAETTSNDDTGAPAACRNPDLSDLVATGEAENPDYSRDGSLVGSGSAVFRNERDARAAWDRVSRQPLEQCALSAFKKGMTGTGAKLHVVSSGRPALPNLTPGFRAYRLRFTVKASGTTLSGRLGYYVFWRGRADAALFLISLDRPLQPISPALERKLAELMAQRMRR